MIDFNQVSVTVLPNFKGGEGQLNAKMLGDDLNRILHATLAPGHSIGLHTHDTSSEIIYFLSGKGTVITDGIPEAVEAGLCHYCKKGSAHTLINSGEEDLVFFAVVPQQ